MPQYVYTVTSMLKTYVSVSFRPRESDTKGESDTSVVSNYCGEQEAMTTSF